MAEKTKLQIQIEASAKRIQEEQRRLKQLEKQQAERERKDRNHRLCKRHGFLESILPDTINLTDEQFQAFVKNHIANKHGIAAIADFMAKNATSTPTDNVGQSTQSNTPSSTAPTGTKPQTTATPAPNGTGQNNGNQQPKQSAQNTTNPANKQGATA